MQFKIEEKCLIVLLFLVNFLFSVCKMGRERGRVTVHIPEDISFLLGR